MGLQDDGQSANLAERLVSRRAVLAGAGAAGIAFAVAACSSSGSNSADKPTDQASGRSDLESLVFAAPPAPDKAYEGTNSGGLVGNMALGTYPKGRLPWLDLKPKKRYKIGYSIFNSAFPLPLAFAARGKLDAECMGVDVMTYDNAGDATKSIQNASLMLQQGVEFGIHLVLSPDACQRISDMFDQAGVPQLFYAVGPTESKKPFLTLPDYGVEFKVGTALGNYAKMNWNGRVDAVLLVGQMATGVTSTYRMSGGRAGIESVVGPIDSSKVFDIDGKDGLLEQSEAAVAAWLTAHPTPKNILVVGFADTHAVGAVRALESADRSQDAAAGGQPGVPDGLNELKKGAGKSAFVVSELQDLAYASWPVALAIYALEGGTLPDVCAFSSQQYTAANIASLPSQSNNDYSCSA